MYPNMYCDVPKHVLWCTQTCIVMYSNKHFHVLKQALSCTQTGTRTRNSRALRATHMAEHVGHALHNLFYGTRSRLKAVKKLIWGTERRHRKVLFCFSCITPIGMYWNRDLYVVKQGLVCSETETCMVLFTTFLLHVRTTGSLNHVQEKHLYEYEITYKS